MASRLSQGALVLGRTAFTALLTTLLPTALPCITGAVDGTARTARWRGGGSRSGCGTGTWAPSTAGDALTRVTATQACQSLNLHRRAIARRTACCRRFIQHHHLARHVRRTRQLRHSAQPPRIAHPTLSWSLRPWPKYMTKNHTFTTRWPMSGSTLQIMDGRAYNRLRIIDYDYNRNRNRLRSSKSSIIDHNLDFDRNRNL